MNPQIRINSRQWVAAAKALKEKSKRTSVDFINGQALRVASLALKETKHADAVKIERELGAIARSVSFKTLSRGKNKGKIRTKKGGYQLASQDTLAHRILLARHKATGSFGVKGATSDDRAANLIRSRIASSNFIRSGWISAIRKLSSVVRKKPMNQAGAVSGVKQRGAVKGFAIPAREASWKMMATIVNTALNALVKPPSTRGDPYKFGFAGLQKAIDMSAKDMMEELARRLRPDFKSVSK